MVELGLLIWGPLMAACLLIGLLIGWAMGRRQGINQSEADHRSATEEHENYREDVRTHFEETSAIMSRMVEDYRQMYQHVSKGAGKLADIHPERVITPPPAPEAITADGDSDDDAPTEVKADAEPAVSTVTGTGDTGNNNRTADPASAAENNADDAQETTAPETDAESEASDDGTTG